MASIRDWRPCAGKTPERVARMVEWFKSLLAADCARVILPALADPHNADRREAVSDLYETAAFAGRLSSFEAGWHMAEEELQKRRDAAERQAKPAE